MNLFELIPNTIYQVVLTWCLWTGNPMYNGEYPHPGAAACSWNFPIGTRLMLPAGDIVVCKDRGHLGSVGHIDIYVNNRTEGRILTEFYGDYTKVRVIP